MKYEKTAQIQLPGKWFHSYVKLSEILQCLLLSFTEVSVASQSSLGRTEVLGQMGSPVWPVAWLQEDPMASTVPDGEEE